MRSMDRLKMSLGQMSLTCSQTDICLIRVRPVLDLLKEMGLITSRDSNDLAADDLEANDFATDKMGPVFQCHIY